MARRLISVLFFVLGSFNICFSEVNFRGIQPGRSTRPEVEKIFGPAVQQISATLAEYKSDKNTEKIYVQYERASNVVERVELLHSRPVERAMVISALNLPSTPSTSKVNTKGKLQEYFSPMHVVLTYASGEPTHVSRESFYSQGLFQKAIPKSDKTGLGPDREGWGFTEETATRLTYYPSPTVAACRADCEKNSQCKAFSWIKPGFYNPGDSAMCYLMSSWNKLIEQSCCISAVKENN